MARRTYICYRRRAAGGCEAPTVPQEVVEADLLAVLRTMAMPPGFARAMDKAVAVRIRTVGKATTLSAAALAEREKNSPRSTWLAARPKADCDRE